MNRTDFLELLKANKIDAGIVVFDHPAGDGYCVRKNYLRWEVCYRERGVEHELVGFPSESDALRYLLGRLTDTSAAR